jgi:hypothetical protein
MQEQLNFRYKLEGNLSEGVEAKVVCTIIHSIEKLINISNKQVKYFNTDIKYSVKPLREGSFIIDFVLQIPDYITWTQEIFTDSPVTRIEGLLKMIGILAIVKHPKEAIELATSVIDLIIILQGEKPDDVKEEGCGKKVYKKGSKEYLVSNDVHNLFGTTKVIQNINYIYHKPLEDERIQSITTCNRNASDPLVRRVSREEACYINKYYNSLEEGRHKIEEAYERLEVVSPKFVTGHDWQFKMRGEDRWIRILDTGFNKQVELREVEFGKGDTLLAKVEITKDASSLEILEVDIIQVTDTIKGKRQQLVI